jgi:hypothetical protein
VKLDRTRNFFSSLGGGFKSDLHEYLIDLRDKHVAHSVNEFEQCKSTTVMVGSADRKTWRVAGIGFTALTIIGLSASMVGQAVAQISKMLELLADTIDQKRKALYGAQRALFAQHGKWEPAPMATLPSRNNVSRRRR